MATKQHKNKALTPKFISGQVLSFYHSRGVLPSPARWGLLRETVLVQMPTQTWAHRLQTAEPKLSGL